MNQPVGARGHLVFGRGRRGAGRSGNDSRQRSHSSLNHFGRAVKDLSTQAGRSGRPRPLRCPGRCHGIPQVFDRGLSVMRQMGARQKIDGRQHSAALSPGKFPPDEEFAGFENAQTNRRHGRDGNSSNHGRRPCKGPERVRLTIDSQNFSCRRNHKTT